MKVDDLMHKAQAGVKHVGVGRAGSPRYLRTKNLSARPRVTGAPIAKVHRSCGPSGSHHPIGKSDPRTSGHGLELSS